MWNKESQLGSIFAYNFGYMVEVTANMPEKVACRYDQNYLQMLHLAEILDSRMPSAGVLYLYYRTVSV